MPSLERSVLVDVPLSRAYAVVTEIERYPEFLPACSSVRVLQRDDDTIQAKVTAGGMGMRETFSTTNVLTEDAVTLVLEDGPFDYLRGEWRFAAVGDDVCRVSLQLEFQPKGLLKHVMAGLIPTVADKMVSAFVKRMVKV
jgi:ribosome-associated toxin RatA of RatAB toxin-antitoxin module